MRCLMKSNRFWLVLSAAVFLNSSVSMARQIGASVPLEKLIVEALEKNPQIKSAERRWLAAQARPAQVSALPDPMFSYARFGSSVETRVGPQENVFSLSQRIPFPGKLGRPTKILSP